MGGAYLTKFWFSQFWQCLGLLGASCLYPYGHNIFSAQLTTCCSGHKMSLSEFSFSNTDFLPNQISFVHVNTFISLKPILVVSYSKQFNYIISFQEVLPS
jgi:hypothetical protein